MRILILAFLLVLAFGGGNPAGAQELPLSFQRYYAKDGLSSNTIYSIYRDSYGFMWLGTEDGLNRFDGTNYKVYRYDANQEHGLRANHITALCEDNEGRIWIGTNGGGLSYYDRKLDMIRSYERTPEGRYLSTAITSVERDAIGNIWVGSYGGLCIINAKNLDQSPKAVYATVVKSFFGKLSRYIFRDSQGNMWVSSEGSIYRVAKDLKAIKKYQILSAADMRATSIELSSITEDKNERIWVGSMLGLTYLDKGRSAFTPFVSANDQSLSSKRIYALGKDNRGGVWVGTDNGLDVIDADNFSVHSFRPDPGNVHSLSHKSIRSIYLDQYGIYWVGTFQGGLNKYDTNLSQISLKGIDVFQNRSGNANMVTSFLEYHGKVFIGVDAGGVYVYDRTTDKLQPLRTESLLTNDLTVLALEGDGDDLWIATYQQGVLNYNIKTNAVRQYTTSDGLSGLNHNDVFCLKRDFQGNIWVGTNGGGINIIQRANGAVKKYLRQEKKGIGAPEPAGNYVRVLEEDSEHNMWIGTYGSGISVYSPKLQRTVFYDRYSSGLPSNYVLAIHVDKHGNAWVGTNGNGVGFLAKGTDRFVTISEKDGLINEVVQSIVEADDGKIWFATNKGLSCYDSEKKVFKNYAQSAGLQDGAFMLGAGVKLGDGEIFFGGQNGFNHFYPKNLKMNKNPAKVVLTDLKIDNTIVPPSADGPIQQSLLTTDRIHLDYKQNFSISFAALNLTVPEDNLYVYRLIGFDKNWIPGGKEHSAYYTNLDPGTYTFQVKASNNDGVWSDEVTSVEIVVAPPFWRTVYAYIFYVLLVAGLLLYIRDRGIKKLKDKFALEQERIQAKQLIAQQKREAEALHKLDNMKIKFLTNLSHEFRTPISLIVGPIDNLISQVQDFGARNQLDLVKRNARRLLNLVNQLLDFRKMEEHELKLQNTDGDLVGFVKDVVQSFNDMALKKGIDYSFNSCKEQLYSSFDEDKVERILFNLISNAFKFTPKGGDIAVNIIDLVHQEDKVRVYVEVRDTGVGIPAEAHAAIFESFFQHDADAKVLNQGSGIGLSIVESFVRMYQGNVRVDSTPDKGSTFTFDLLLALRDEPMILTSVADDMEETIAEMVPAGEYRQKPVVLIVEDDDDFRYYLEGCLQDTYQVLEAVNGKEGWQKALFHHPDIIISDVQMPLMNGMELAQKLAQDKRTKHIPIVLMTASQVENGLVCGLESGAVDYVTKPFDVQVLLAKINSLLLLNQAFKDVYSKQVSLATPEMEVVTEKDKFLQTVLAYVYDNIDNPQLSVEALSAHLSISRASLYNRLLEYTGMSPVDFIRSAKLEKAAALLEKSDKTIAEIAYETGFANPNYFTKVFKVKYQMTPSEYIQSLRKTGVQ